MNDTVEIGMDVQIRVSVLRECIRILCNEEGDSFAGKMLREELNYQREARRMEQNRIERETIARQNQIEQLKQNQDD
jgi:hypothetical protein